MKERFWAIVPAAGTGTRLGGDRPKQYQLIQGRTTLEWSLDTLLRNPRIEKVVVVLAGQDAYWPQCPMHDDPRIMMAPGGAERFQSVYNGLMHLQTHCGPGDWVLVHDAARPCLHGDDLDALMNTTVHCGDGAILAAPVNDTLKKATTDNHINITVDRNHLWRAMTPQMFRHGQLLDALEQVVKHNQMVTDEAQAIERQGGRVLLVPCRSDNIKVTFAEDMDYAGFILRNRTTSK